MLTDIQSMTDQINPHMIGYYDDKGHLTLVNLNAPMSQNLQETIFEFAKHLAQMTVWNRLKAFAERVYGQGVYSLDILIEEGYTPTCVDITAYDRFDEIVYPVFDFMYEDIIELLTTEYLVDDMFFWFVANTEINRWTNTPYLVE